jgi:hypothetical protein
MQGLRFAPRPFVFFGEVLIEFARRTNLRFSVVVLCLLCSVVLAGCKSGPDLPPTVPVEGVLTLDGKPVAEATIIFIADQGVYNATGTTDTEGRFEMSAFQEKKGVVVGSYKVEMNKTIVEPRPGGREGESDVNLKLGLPKRYNTFTTSGITINVTDAGQQDLKFELKSK